MLRHLTALIFLCSIAATANAGTYKDPADRFDLTVPTGWSHEKPDDDSTFEIVHEATASAPFTALCSGMYDAMPDTRSQTQQELDEELSGEITPEFWRRVIPSNDGKMKTAIDTAGTRKSDGRSVHYVVFTATEGDSGARAKLEAHFVPGSMHLVLCLTKERDYNAASADLDTIFESYAPHSGVVVSSNEVKAPSALTMFANANFKGAARVLMRDTANLAAAGWPTSSASLTVDGDEPWQVCSGADYAGQCWTVIAADAGDGRPNHIGSARRIAGKISPANLVATRARRAVRQLLIKH